MSSRAAAGNDYAKLFVAHFKSGYFFLFLQTTITLNAKLLSQFPALQQPRLQQRLTY